MIKNSGLAPLILTLKLDESTFDTLDRLRQQYFPPARNFLSAHITLFHALPGEERQKIGETLRLLAQTTPELALTFPKLLFLGGGVAVGVECPALVKLRNQLATDWQAWLSRQDRQGYRPHVTIQNKVEASEARQLHAQLSEDWQPLVGAGKGLFLWRYLGGPWQLEEEFRFQNWGEVGQDEGMIR